MSTDVHKVFVSFHSDDKVYREHFEQILKNNGIAVLKSVEDGEYENVDKTETIIQRIRDEHISDSTVTVVLVGANTWRRKYVDWEISATIRDTLKSPRGGLLGILLPTYPLTADKRYNPRTIPPRLYNNIIKGYASWYSWTTDPEKIQGYIHEAFKRRNDDHTLPDNSYTLYARNHDGPGWT